jgi:D-alanyl-D-alanine dipeptidase
MKGTIGALLILLGASPAGAEGVPEGFVWLKDVAPTIEQEIRYHGYHNFLGRPVAGYQAPECVLTRETAEALRAIQAELAQSRLSLKVYDCYRPQRAVDDFVRWSEDVADQEMKAEFYPRARWTSPSCRPVMPPSGRTSPVNHSSTVPFRRTNASPTRASTSAQGSTAWTRSPTKAGPISPWPRR